MDKRERLVNVSDAAVTEKSIRFHKTKTGLLYDPAIPRLCIYIKELKTVSQRDACTLIFTEVFLTIAKNWKQPQCP